MSNQVEILPNLSHKAVIHEFQSFMCPIISYWNFRQGRSCTECKLLSSSLNCVQALSKQPQINQAILKLFGQLLSVAHFVRPREQSNVNWLIEFYIGSAAQTFKGWFSGHRTSMNNPNFRNKGSTISKIIWELKDEGVNFQIKWRIVDTTLQSKNKKMYALYKRSLLYQLP